MLPSRPMRRSFAPVVLAVLATAGITSDAQAFVWPNVPGRIAKALQSSDPVERRGAVKQARELPPELAEPLLRTALGDDDTEVRIGAAEGVSQLKLKGTGDIVIPWLSEKDPKLRLAACNVILVSPTPRAILALGRVLGDPSPAVRLAAAHALGASESPDAVSPLLGHLDDDAPEVRAEVATSLGKLADVRAVLPLVSKVRDGAPEVRKRVARALGSLGDARAVSALVLTLGDPNLDVRLESIRALGLLGSDDATAALMPLAAGTSDGVTEATDLPPTEASLAVRQSALDALGRIGSAKAIGVLVEALERDRPDAMRMPARDALVRIGAPAVKALIAHLAGAPSPAGATGAALSLGTIGDPSALDPIVRAMQRGTLPVVAGLRALALLKAPASLPPVLELLDDGDAKVRRAAVAAARAVLDPRSPDGRAVEPIEDALESATDVEERLALIDLLGRTGAVRVAPVLVALAGKKSVSEKRAAVSALGGLGASSADVDAALVKALDDENASVRSDAALALARVGRGELGAPLLSRLVDAAEQDRGALGVALSGVMSRSSSNDLATRAAASVDGAPDLARDALIEGLGRMSAGGALSALVGLGKGDADDRRKVAEALAGQKSAGSALETFVKDADPSVRAAAVWSLAKVGDAKDVSTIAELVSDPDVSVAVNAAGGVGLLLERFPADKTVATAAHDPLCHALGDTRSYVRANALTSLASGAITCDAGVVVGLLASDPSEVVRAAAASDLRRNAADPVVKKALARCASDDHDATVAEVCERGAVAKATPARFDLGVFVVPDGKDAPVPRTAFSLVLPGGMVRTGLTDRRGAIFETAVPDGTVQLGVPAALAP